MEASTEQALVGTIEKSTMENELSVRLYAKDVYDREIKRIRSELEVEKCRVRDEEFQNLQGMRNKEDIEHVRNTASVEIERAHELASFCEHMAATRLKQDLKAATATTTDVISAEISSYRARKATIRDVLNGRFKESAGLIERADEEVLTAHLLKVHADKQDRVHQLKARANMASDQRMKLQETYVNLVSKLPRMDEKFQETFQKARDAYDSQMMQMPVWRDGDGKL